MHTHRYTIIRRRRLSSQITALSVQHIRNIGGGGATRGVQSSHLLVLGGGSGTGGGAGGGSARTGGGGGRRLVNVHRGTATHRRRIGACHFRHLLLMVPSATERLRARDGGLVVVAFGQLFKFQNSGPFSFAQFFSQRGGVNFRRVGGADGVGRRRYGLRDWRRDRMLSGGDVDRSVDAGYDIWQDERGRGGREERRRRSGLAVGWRQREHELRSGVQRGGCRAQDVVLVRIWRKPRYKIGLVKRLWKSVRQEVHLKRDILEWLLGCQLLALS